MMHVVLRWLLLLGWCGVLHVAAGAEDAVAPAVPLLPEGSATLDIWTHHVSLAAPTDPSVTATLRLPANPTIELETPVLDQQGMVWHILVPEPVMYGEIRFVATLADPELAEGGIDSFELFKASTLFAVEAIALTNSADCLEVESPVRIEGALYRGLFRAKRYDTVTAVAALAIPIEESESAADLRATAWASLRAMDLPPAPSIAVEDADPGTSEIDS